MPLSARRRRSSGGDHRLRDPRHAHAGTRYDHRQRRAAVHAGRVSATQDQIAWVLTSYIVAAAIMTPPTGFLAGRFGLSACSSLRRRLHRRFDALRHGAILGADRAVPMLQGLFGAALVPLSQSMLLNIYPQERQGSAMALWGVAVMAGPVLGPLLGGWLTEAYSWR